MGEKESRSSAKDDSEDLRSFGAIAEKLCTLKGSTEPPQSSFGDVS